MATRLARLLRGQAVGVLALLLALGTGTAYAVAARNSVASSSIKDGEVKRVDLARGAVTRSRVSAGAVDGSTVKDGSLTGADLADGTITGADLADGTIGPDDIATLDGSVLSTVLGGVDVDESTLTSVPTATQAGTGRYDGSGFCDPESAAFVACATIFPLAVPSAGRVLLLGRVTASTEPNSDLMWGTCTFEIDNVVQGDSYLQLRETDTGSGDTVRSSAGLYAVTPTLAAGTHTVSVICRQENVGAITYGAVSIAAVLLGPS